MSNSADEENKAGAPEGKSNTAGSEAEWSNISEAEPGALEDEVEISPPAPAKPRGRPFARGRSGNPNGRPKGARNKATLAAEALLEGEAEALTRKLIEKAKEGDINALRLCLDRIYPPRRDRLVSLEMPEIGSALDASKAAAALLAACAAGEISAREAAGLMDLVARYVGLLEIGEIETRLQALENASGVSS
jgi:hypothetical protein